MSVVLVLGVVYTLKVLDIILGLTGGGPANATQTLATQSYQLSFVQFDFGAGRRAEQRPDRHLARVRHRSTCAPPAGRSTNERADARPDPAAVARRHTPRRSAAARCSASSSWRCMLFPVYWMVNARCSRGRRGADAVVPACTRRFAGLRDGARAAGRATCVTSLIIATRQRACSACSSRRRPPTRWRSSGCAARGVVALRAPDQPDDPGIVVANALYSAYNDLGLLNSLAGPDPRRLRARHPVRDPDHAGVHGHPSRRASSRRRGSTAPGNSAPSSRSCCRSAATR